MTVWDLYFCQLAGWLMHPGYQREGSKLPSLEEIADLADRMLAVRERRVQ